MVYETITVIATVTSCALSSAYAIACHRTYKAFGAWPKWGRGKAYLDGHEEFLRRDRTKTFAFFAMLFSFSVTYTLTSLLGAYHVVDLDHAWLLADCAIYSFMAFGGALMIASLRQCVMR
jgi:hypothetical protein